MQGHNSLKIAVVIPCYRVGDLVLDVINRIDDDVHRIFVVDDACPIHTGNIVESRCKDNRVSVVYCKNNLGVGGATMMGINSAIEDGADVIIKLDGDNQMDPSHIPVFVSLIQSGEADFAKGNRFFEPEGVADMPLLRLIGNAALSFFSKLSTGYWSIFDPTNGYFAVHAEVIGLLPLEKISKRYFFESDLLFRLGTIRARVIDVPMHSIYAGEVSSLNPLSEIPRFAASHLKNTIKRLFYMYFIRDFSVASLELVLGITLIVFGTLFGLMSWGVSTPATPGTVMLAALPIFTGIQLLLSFINYDIAAVPKVALHRLLTTQRAPSRILKSEEKNR
ncbi:glycosyltransferase [Nitratireductor indicus]|uniref:glycosyltransferase n=1 Tax=Nitratireductor indicus TaxID=721133 RepID=UPI000593FB76|nr:glycosyltransferase [Nitratireductor indicus]